MSTILIIIIILAVALVVFGIFTYNELVGLKQKVKNGFSQIDVQLQKRFDLIPNLVETVKGYAAHEASTLEKVTQMRVAWSNAKTVDEKIKLDNEFSKAISSIYAVSENYPELKANANFLELQSELKEAEDKISYSRQFYNDIVTKYNTKIKTFPASIIASMFNFKDEELFEVTNDAVRENVKVSFDK